MVLPAVCEYVEDHDFVFKNGNCIVRDPVTELYGAIDTLGNPKLPMEYTIIFDDYDTEGMLYLRKCGKCGLADASLNVVFEPEYDNVAVSCRGHGRLLLPRCHGYQNRKDGYSGNIHRHQHDIQGSAHGRT